MRQVFTEMAQFRNNRQYKKDKKYNVECLYFGQKSHVLGYGFRNVAERFRHIRNASLYKMFRIDYPSHTEQQGQYNKDQKNKKGACEYLSCLAGYLFKAHGT